MSDERFDVVVIGGGTAGLVTASGCARLGRKVALIEREALGGDCLWTGCVPTKALVSSGRLVHHLRNAGAWGLAAGPSFDVDSPRIMQSMREIQKSISRHDAPEKFRGLGIDVIEGEARLTNGHRVLVGSRALHARHIVIATGSRTFVPPVPGLEEAGFLDHASFLAQDAIPRSVAILGGGAIGVEFSQLFRRFGSRVYLVELGRGIVLREDPDVTEILRRILTEEGVEFRTGWKAVGANRRDAKKVLTIRASEGEEEELEVDEIFVASGRRGNVENLGLEEAGVRVERSYVHVDRALRTSASRIWACGDVKGPLQFTHVAAYEAVKLVRNMLFPGTSAISYEHIPWGVYTDPEIGRIGLTEPEAVEKYGREAIRTYRVDMEDVDRAVVDRASRGLLKLVCDQRGRILGAHALATNASTLIQTLVLARKEGVRIGGLAGLVSPYPSLADAIQKAGALHYQELASGWMGRVARKIAGWGFPSTTPGGPPLPGRGEAE